jgi:hypothetical protein
MHKTRAAALLVARYDQLVALGDFSAPKDQREYGNESWIVSRDKLPTISAAKAAMSMKIIPVPTTSKMNGRMAILKRASQFFGCFMEEE